MAQHTDAPPRTPDTANKFLVVGRGNLLALMRPPIAGAALTLEQATNLAGWLTVMIDSIGEGRGSELLARTIRAIEGT